VTRSCRYQDANTGLYHYYAVQTVNGLEVVNGVADVHFDRYGNALTAANGFVSVSSLQRRDTIPTPDISATAALQAYAKTIGLDLTGATLKEVANADGSITVQGVPFALQDVKATVKAYNTGTALEKVYALQVHTTVWFHEAYVSAKTGELVGKADWQTANFWEPPATTKTAKRSMPEPVTEKFNPTEMIHSFKKLGKRQAGGNIPKPKYRAIPFGGADLRSSPPVLLDNPVDLRFSPLGWHDMGDGQGQLAITAGNNVIAQENRANANNPLNNARPESANFVFDFRANDQNQAPPQYQDASITNMFFLANAYHDVLAAYGFDEQAGNFQVTNANGGAGNDPVIANAQDGSGTDNANFSTPPDGQAGLMRMFVFTQTNPQRDGNFQNDIPVHELTHGLSNRLTGGPANSNCLNSAQAGGMGEGWSDFFGVSLKMTAADTRATDKAVGDYVMNNQLGVRAFAYSTDVTRNPLRFSDLADARFQQVHNAGTLWNTMLFESYWNLVDKLGFTSDFKDVASKKGNTLMMQYVVNGLKLQPCNPTFIQARDAILAAEQQLTNGENKCEVLAGFVKRGMGLAARQQGNTFTNDFNLPAECAGKVNNGNAQPAGATGR
ncbi:Fungalysin metallopeptidase-domain-containing protein, partial [Gaertneriomyces semiglobifer]